MKMDIENLPARQLTDSEIRRELKTLTNDSQRYTDLMEELEERVIVRGLKRTPMHGWHAATDKCEGM